MTVKSMLMRPQGLRPGGSAFPHLLPLLRNSMWSVVCSSAPHLQFAEGTKPHLCIVEWNSPTPVRRRFSLTQEGLGRVITGGEGPGDGKNVWRREVSFCHFIIPLMIRPESCSGIGLI